MSQRSTGSVSFVRRPVAAAESLPGRVAKGENPAGLFQAVTGGARGIPDLPPRPSRLSGEAFVASSGAASTKLESVLAGKGCFVSTGQQPGLFLGPLFTLYKLASAIKHARRLEDSTGLPHLALFWVAADDHDWAEVGTCAVLSKDESVTRLSLPAVADQPRRSVGTSVLPPVVEDLLTDLTSCLPPGVTEENPFLESLADAYSAGETVSGAFVRLLSQVFRGSDFVLLDSAHPLVRKGASQLYQRIVENPEPVLAAMSQGKESVEAAGFDVLLNPPVSGLQFFADTDEGREHVLSSADGYCAGGGTSWSRTELTESLTNQAQRFTPAAALRPVVESWLLPVHTAVLGPGEVGYWAQLLPLFEALGVTMPTVALRQSWYLVEPRVERLLGKLDTNPEAVEADVGALRKAVIEAARPASVETILNEMETSLARQLEAMEEAGAAELPGMIATVSKTRKAVHEAISGLRKAIDGHVANSQETVLGQIDRLSANLVPEGQAQERALGSVGFLARYGTDLVRHLLDEAYVAGTRGQD